MSSDPSCNESVVVRAAMPGDFDQWLPLWEGYNAFYGRTGATALGDDVTADRWAAFHAPAVPMWALVACRGDSLIGLAHYIFHPSTTSLAPACYMQDLFTRTDERGTGIGAALIDAIAARARLAGSVSIYWQTQRTNGVAMRLYDRVAIQSEFVIYRLQLASRAR